MSKSQIESIESGNGPRHWFIPLYASAITATVLALPLFLFHPSGHDLRAHLASWMDIRGQWHQGIWFPRWAEWSNFGFGEPRFIFYPPSSALLGAALGSILPWKAVPAVLVWLSLFAAAVCMYKLASDWLVPQQAVLAAVLFATNPYNVVEIYYRSAFAELMAASLFPLMIWGAIRITRGEWRRAPLLAMVFAAIWLTNAPAAVIASYALVLVLVVCCVVRRKLWPLIPATVSVVLGFGLAAFYVVPAWYEQRWIDLASLISADGNPERNFLFSLNNRPDFLGFNWIVSTIAVCLMLLTGTAVAMYLRRQRIRSDLWWSLTVLALISSLLMFPLSTVLWRHLPKLQFLQFPWRWLIVLTVAFAVLVPSVAAVKPRRFLFVAVFMCAAALALSARVRWGGHDMPEVVEQFASGAGYFATTNFTPIGANRFVLEEHEPLLQRVGQNGELVGLDDVKVQVGTWSAERKVFSVQAKEEITLALKLLNYPSWEVFIDGQRASASSFPRNGQMLITLADGEHGVEVRFGRTRDRTIGGVISLVSLIMLSIATGICWHGRNRKPKTV